MESMTGYACLEKQTEQFSFNIEIKSLNSKYLEVFVNLPKILSKYEEDINNKIKDKLYRGKIVCNIEIIEWKKQRPVTLNKEMIKKYYRELKKIENELKANSIFSGDIIFSLDNVILKEKSVLTEQSYSDIMIALSGAIDKAIKMRLKEGASTKKDILCSLQKISDNLEEISKESKEIAKNIFNKIKKNIELISEKEIDDNRLYTEIAILADKIDINEEIVRLNDHMIKFKSVIGQKGQIGKSLDFLAQEMFRETNTIGSKSNSSSVSHKVVEIKNYIDKIREQCRNII